MQIDIKIASLSDLCPYCFGNRKLKAMQRAMTYSGESVRVNDKTVICYHCNGTGKKKV